MEHEESDSDNEVYEDGSEEVEESDDNDAPTSDFKYNKVALEAKLEEIALPSNWPWIEVNNLCILHN